jgi:hypothetical protein
VIRSYLTGAEIGALVRGYPDAKLLDLYRTAAEYPGTDWAVRLAAEIRRRGLSYPEELYHLPDRRRGTMNGLRQKLLIPIRPDEDAVLYVTLPMSDEDWDQLMAVLGAMKPGIVRGVTMGSDTDG